MIITSDLQIYGYIFLFNAVVLFILLWRLWNKYNKWWESQSPEDLEKKIRFTAEGYSKSDRPFFDFFHLCVGYTMVLIVIWEIPQFGLIKVWSIPYDLISVFLLLIVTIIVLICYCLRQFLIKNPK